MRRIAKFFPAAWLKMIFTLKGKKDRNLRLKIHCPGCVPEQA
jgi:hypothetical protein